jgi:catechol 2,3-dioxygenase-like lactoylglutathione lyase family enzyme
MDRLYARSVFFVKDAARSRAFYIESLGFSLDWDANGVFQVSLFGFELILNETDVSIEARAGQGRVYIGINDDEQLAAFRQHIEAKRIDTSTVQWGQSTLVIRDLDGNELYFWHPRHEAW